jgi:hypothetical protein
LNGLTSIIKYHPIAQHGEIEIIENFVMITIVCCQSSNRWLRLRLRLGLGLGLRLRWVKVRIEVEVMVKFGVRVRVRVGRLS